jgi:ABC-type nitrate/sulfonate/bicarbonate transport system permease component
MIAESKPMTDRVTGNTGDDASRAADRRVYAPRITLGSKLRMAVAMVDPLRLAGLCVFVLVWQAVSMMLPSIILPPPLSVARRLATDFLDAPSLSYYGLDQANLYANLLYTVENVVVAVVVGAAIGITAGLVSARFALIRAMIDPLMMTAGTVPILVAAPFLLIWFGVGRASAVCLVIFYVCVILYLFAQRAVVNLNPIYEDFARTLGATQRQILRDVLLPATVPEILGGLKIALAGAWGLEAISELLGAQEGLGKVLEVLAGATDSEGIMATLLLLGLVAVIVDIIAGWAVQRATRWSSSFRSERS